MKNLVFVAFVAICFLACDKASPVQDATAVDSGAKVEAVEAAVEASVEAEVLVTLVDAGSVVTSVDAATDAPKKD